MTSLTFTTHTKTQVGQDSTNPPTDEPDTSGGWVDVTNCVVASIPDGHYYKWGISYDEAGPGTVEVRLIDSDTMTVLDGNTNSTSSVKAYKSAVLQNTKGSAMNVKVQQTSGTSTTVTAKQATFFLWTGPYRNVTDDLRKMSIGSVYMMGTTEGVQGGSGSTSVLTTVPVNGILTGGLVWSANSGNMIYDFDGFIAVLA